MPFMGEQTAEKLRGNTLRRQNTASSHLIWTAMSIAAPRVRMSDSVLCFRNSLGGVCPQPAGSEGNGLPDLFGVLYYVSFGGVFR